MKGVKKCVILLICLACLLHCFVFRAACLDYSADSPSYVNEVGNFYIEVSTVEVGRGTILLPNNYKYDYLSTLKNSDKLYNTYSSTLSGYIYTSTGNYYQVRFQAFSEPQYYTGSGVGYGWQDLTINQLYTSNGSILGTNGQKVYNVPDSDRIVISILLIGFLVFMVFYSVIYLIGKKRD